MEETIEIELTVPVTIKFEAIKAERMTRHYPGCPAHLEFNSMEFMGVPFSTELFDAIYDEFEDEINDECMDYVYDSAMDDVVMRAEYRRDAMEDR